MDYEKKYKEALEKARKYFDEEGFTEMADIFPELAESEDELTRQEMIAVIRSISSDCQFAIYLTNDQKQRYLAWLEKQKEPHYTKRNELFDKCVENCDPATMKEVSNKVDEWNKKPCLTCQEYKKGYAQGR